MGRFQNFDNQFIGVTWSVYLRDQVDTVQSKVSEITLNKEQDTGFSNVEVKIIILTATF